MVPEHGPYGAGGGAPPDERRPRRRAGAVGRHCQPEQVRATVPAHRLLEWQPADGWEPLCAALDLPVPDEPFPHENTTADMRARIGDLDRR
ncbi:sulfotransferase [Nonomuraea solani]|uniref:sulfotransferase n=1 Tax=Nonomuraea solani TaxID=1144553 RepID=UPI00389912FC